MARNATIGSIGCGDDCEDKMVKKLLLTFKNSSKILNYLTLDAKHACTQLKQTLIKAQIPNILIWNVLSGLKPTYQAMPLVEF